MTMTSALLAVTTRSGRVESEHYGQLVAVDSGGNVLFAIGDPNAPTYMRSAAKPFQAMTALSAGCATAFSWTAEEIAVVCASHAAEDEHLVLVRSILAKADLQVGDLRCGPHPPVSARTRRTLERTGRSPSRIHNNCSGKHAGMLAACRLRDWPLESYLDAEHPLQVANLATLARFANRCPDVIATGTDGCGVPSFYLPVQAMATAFARLAAPHELGEQDQAAASQVFDAMGAHPSAIAGSGRFNSQLNQFLAGQGVGKGGAEGVFGIALRNPNVGIALKVSDGSSRCHGAIILSVLQRFLPELDWASFRLAANPPIRNTRGETVGEILAAI